VTRYYPLLLGLLLAGGCVPAPEPAGPAPGSSPKEVAEGRDLYHGLGACATCHGEAGVGTPEGPALVGGMWQMGDGSLPWLIHMTRHGGLGARTREDDPQPMRGPTVLDSVQVRRVAAYVWSISRDRLPAGPSDR